MPRIKVTPQHRKLASKRTRTPKASSKPSGRGRPRSGGTKVKIKRRDRSAVFRIIDEEISATSKREVGRIARAVRDEVKAVLESQRLANTWPPLNPDYLAEKKELGLDERMLIATGDYLESIQVVETETRLGGVITFRAVAAPPAGEIHEPSGLEYDLLARVHEYGSAKARVPARPHWRPVVGRMKRAKDSLGQGARKATIEEMKRRMHRLRWREEEIKA